MSEPIPEIRPYKQFENEGERWDRVIEIVVPVAGAAGAAWISPEVSAADGWVAVFIATLAWSLGCAISVYVLMTNNLSGWPAAYAMGGSFIVSIIVAAGLGKGVLDSEKIMSLTQSGGGPPVIRFLFAVAATAFVTLGVVGTILGGGIGVWLGIRVAQHHGSA